MNRPLCLLAMSDSRALGEAVAGHLRCPLGRLEERTFPDGEHKCRPLESVRERDVYLVQGLHEGPERSTHDKLVRLLFLVTALKDHGALRVTTVIPYLSYQRKERRTQPRDPVNTRALATLLEAAGTDRVISMDVHQVSAFQNSFRIPAEHLEARPLFTGWLAEQLGEEGAIVVSPDPGGIRRAEAARASLEQALGRRVDAGFVDKHRGRPGGGTLVGEAKGRISVLVDDLISTGETLGQAARACRAGGAARVLACATHGLFLGLELLQAREVDQIAITDTVPPFRIPAPLRVRLRILSVAGLIGEVIHRLNRGGSLVDLLHPPTLRP